MRFKSRARLKTFRIDDEGTERCGRLNRWQGQELVRSCAWHTHGVDELGGVREADSWAVGDRAHHKIPRERAHLSRRPVAIHALVPIPGRLGQPIDRDAEELNG